TIAGEPTSPGMRQEVAKLAKTLPTRRLRLLCRFIDEDEVSDLFKSCSALVMPYTSFSAQSGVLHLAVVHGTPVVVSDVAGLAEDVRGWEIGEVAAPNDHESLANAIRNLHQPARYAKAF